MIAAALVPAPVRAAHAIYPPIVEQGEIALEYVPTSRWMTELGGESEKEPTGSLRSTAICRENICLLTEQGQHRADFGLLAEREFEDGGKAELEYAFRWRYRMGEAFEPGVELHGELGEWGGFGSATVHRHRLGPADFAAVTLQLEKRLGPTTATLDVLRTRELTGGPAHAVEYRVRWTAPGREQIEVGVEACGRMRVWGVDDAPESRTHEVGPAVYGTFGGTRGDEFAYEAVLRFGVGGDASSRTLPFQLTGGF